MAHGAQSGQAAAPSVGGPFGELVALVERLAPASGRSATLWPGLRCFRTTRRTMADPTVYTPSVCIVAQGAKEVTLGEHTFRYDPFHYLVIGAHMPLRSTVLEASDERPFLSLIFDVDTSAVHELLLEMEDAGEGLAPVWEGTPPLRASRMDGRLLDAVVRFLGAVEEPLDRRILAPAALREVFYLLLRRDQGDLLRLATRRDGRSPGVARALHFIHGHLGDRLDIATIAREAGMSASSLHHSFKSAVALTPIQYVKRLRLNRARQLMVDEGCSASEAAFSVGYESPSQFSREFRELFGRPPRRYVAGLREAGAAY